MERKKALKERVQNQKEAKLYEARLEAGVVAPTVSTDKPNPKVTYKELYQEWFNAYVGTVEEQLLPKLRISIEYIFYQYLAINLLTKSVL